MITYRKLGRMGRFAAQLQQFAHTRLYAEINGFSFALPNWIGCNVFQNIPSYNMFELITSRFLPTSQLDDIRSYGKYDRIKYLLGLTKKLPDTVSLKNLYGQPRDWRNLYGYFNDDFAFELLAQHKAKVREWFVWQDKIQKAFQHATHKYHPWVAVHVRRGDFVRLGFDIPVRDYVQALERVRGNRNIVVCSDDPSIYNEFKSFCPSRPLNPLPDMPGFIFDFWLLQNAQTLIGGGSGFAWWASYLSENGDYYAPPLTNLWKKGKQPEISKQSV